MSTDYQQHLFHANLSNEFDDVYTSQIATNRDYRQRDPYELLDDVPPANRLESNQLFPDLLEEESPNVLLRASTTRVDNRSSMTRFESELNAYPDGLLDDPSQNDAKTDRRERTEHSSSQGGQQRERERRYPVEELYPNDNHDIYNYPNHIPDDQSKDTPVEYELNEEQDYYSQMQYSEPITVKGPSSDRSRYPIDDVKKTVGWYDYDYDTSKENGLSVAISPADSGEIDSYQSMHNLYNTKGANKDYYDNASSHYSDDKSHGTFDRLYNEEAEEYSGVYSTPNKSHYDSKEDYVSVSRKSPKNSPDSVIDTPSSNASSSYLGDLVFGKEGGGDVNGVGDHPDVNHVIEKEDEGGTPLRSNQNDDDEKTKFRHHEPPIIPFEEEETPREDRMQVDETTPVSSNTGSPQSNTTTSSNSPGFGSDDSVIRHLARTMQEQQRRHRENQRQENTSLNEAVSRGTGRMSRLEQWQQKQRQREERRQQQMVASYLPLKYQQESAARPSQKKQMEPEPEYEGGHEPDGVRYYANKEEGRGLFPDMEWDENGRVIKKPRSNQRTPTDPVPDVVSPLEQYGQNHNDYTYNQMTVEDRDVSPTNRARTHQVPDELSLVGSYSGWSSNQNTINNSHDEVSVISVDTELRQLAEQVPMKNKLQHQSRLHPYSIKPKDSMESDMRIDLDRDEEIRGFTHNHGIKRNDSMEQDMIADFDDMAVPTKRSFVDDVDHSLIEYFDDNSQMGNSVLSPPMVNRKHFVFTDQIDEEEEEDIIAELISYSDDSEATNDPALFPTRAVYQMNLGQLSTKNEGCQSNDMIERACELLARGRNADALDALSKAFNDAEAKMDEVKEKMDGHYYNKERGLNPPTTEQLLSEEEYEEKLDTDFREVASDLADIIK